MKKYSLKHCLKCMPMLWSAQSCEFWKSFLIVRSALRIMHTWRERYWMYRNFRLVKCPLFSHASCSCEVPPVLSYTQVKTEIIWPHVINKYDRPKLYSEHVIFNKQLTISLKLILHCALHNIHSFDNISFQSLRIWSNYDSVLNCFM